MKNFPKRRFFTVLFSGILFGVFLSAYSGSFTTEKKYTVISFKKVSVTAEVSDTEVLRVRGLSGRTSLKEGEGMWFDFASDGYYSFWMKEMNFPIDILWLNKNLQVVSLKENATAESYPEKFTPRSLSRFVLEVPAGFVKKYEVTLGEKVTVYKSS
ncbi:MAG: DUF192 domain-containing protein [Candidatus Parcubacteria bacterium]|nr:DUF192 domain-containing protein [Candidatus Parcubacteria bacterium]